MHIAVKILLLLPIVAFRLAIRIIIGTLVIFIAPLLLLILHLMGVNTDRVCRCYDNWMLMGEWKDE